MTSLSYPDRLRAVLGAIGELLADVDRGELASAEQIRAVPAEMQPSARNLAHYLAARAHDLRSLQADLHALSLSSLGRMEAHVRGTVIGVRRALLALLAEATTGDTALPELSSDDGERRLARHARQLLGPPPSDRTTHIMVTLPSAAACDHDLLRGLLRGGMDVARINLAHDDAATWTSMVQSIRAIAAELGRECRVLVDLPGPKLRTCALPAGPRVLRVRPERDVLGRCIGPAKVVFAGPGAPTKDLAGAAVVVPLTTGLASYVEVGDELVVKDTRGRERSFTVTSVHDRCFATTTDRTAYLGSDCRVVLRRGITDLAGSRIGELPAQPAYVALQVEAELVVVRDSTASADVQLRADGSVVPMHIGCTLPRVFDDVREGQRMLFDDGKFTGVVVANDGERLRVRVTNTPPGGGKLRVEKGINLPDTELQAPALTEHDRTLLDWVAQHADIVGMSFVQRTADVLQLEEEMHRRGRAEIGIILKIETAIGFARLPELLFAGMRNPPLGVMVARGDLAVEVGYERLAEVQEEILWLCEAAHVPVVWATQVLDAMARTGVPSRAEVTDAAMGGRAECVMLNKGPFVVETTRFLAGVLARMQQHTSKKRSLLRRLSIARPPG